MLDAWQDVASALAAQNLLYIGWMLGQIAVVDVDHADVASGILIRVQEGRWDSACALVDARVAACTAARRDGIASAISDIGAAPPFE